MKKYILFFMLLLPVYMQAQSPYHRIGDYIHGPDSIYYRDWWVNQWLDSTNGPVCTMFGGIIAVAPYPMTGTVFDAEMWFTGDFLRRSYTDDTLTVIGMAVIAGVFGDNIRYFDISMSDTLLLYDARPDTFMLMKAVQWNSLDTNYRYMGIDARWRSGCCTNTHGTCYPYEVREYYFEDTPILLTDSFYIGVTHSSYEYRVPPGTGPDDEHIYWYDPNEDSCHNYQTGYMFLYYFSTYNNCEKDSCQSLTPFTYKMRRTGRHPQFYPYNQWFYQQRSEYLCIWPIIYIPPVPFVCPDVENLRVSSYYGNCAILTWDNGDGHNMWQVSYGPEGTQPDDGTIVPAPIQVAQICGLDSGEHYVAYVRALCSHDDSIYYSEWSDGLELYMPAGAEPDTCFWTEGLTVQGINGMEVTLAWEVGNGSEWEVSLVKDDGAPARASNGVISTHSSNNATFSGLDTAYYTAFVRTVCDGGMRSEWSEGVVFNVPQSGPATGVLSLAEQYTQIMPNPAYDRLTVISSFRVKSVELYDVSGRKVQSHTVDGLSAGFDISSLQSGNYIVRIVTAGGTVHKKLVKK